MNKFGLLVVCALILLAGKAWGDAGEPSGVVTRVDSVAPGEYREMVRRLRIDRDGWRARFEGVTAVAPEVVYVTDTLVAPPDTVVRFVRVDSRGTLAVELLTARDSLYAPELRTGYDVSECDEGWQVQAGEVVCDRASLGHLYVGPWLSRRPSLAVWWTPAFRSPWEASVSFDGSRWDFGLRRGIRLW